SQTANSATGSPYAEAVSPVVDHTCHRRGRFPIQFHRTSLQVIGAHWRWRIRVPVTIRAHRRRRIRVPVTIRAHRRRRIRVPVTTRAHRRRGQATPVCRSPFEQLLSRGGDHRRRRFRIQSFILHPSSFIVPSHGREFPCALARRRSHLRHRGAEL